MVSNVDTRCLALFVASVLLTGSAFILPGTPLRPPSAARRRLSEQAVALTRATTATTTASTCWGIRRRSVGPCMMSTSPGDQDSDAAAEDEGADAESNAEGEQGGADAGAGGEMKAQDDEVIGFGIGDTAGDDDIAPLSLLAQGDSLPLSYRSDNGTRESEFFVGDENENVNPYYDVVRRLSPTELIGRFMKTSSPKVQEAVRTTVLGLLGSLPRHAFETTAIATGDALANLMFQLQMTGYMFKNAEYRLSLQSSMRASAALPPGKSIIDEEEEDESLSTSRVEMDDDGNLIIARPKISGKIKLTYDENKETERAMEVDADAYMAELRGQVEQLESQLLMVQTQKEEAVQQDLLVYIKSMPEHQLQGLTAGVSPDVLESMRLLVETVMGGMGDREILSKTLTQQTGSGMAQLCMWQLVVGFNLREMEAREDMRKNFNK
ncbi:unnamed protein product [Ectocarpus sp. 12 AP-2014]